MNVVMTLLHILSLFILYDIIVIEEKKYLYLNKYCFTRFDSDQDGVLSVREVAMVFRTIGCSPTEAELQVQYNSFCQSWLLKVE